MIAQKILKVMESIGPIIKDKTNQEKGFDYASIANIITKAREAMIGEKVIMIPLEVKQVTSRGNDVIINMIYRFYDAEKNEKGICDYLDVNVIGEGCDKDGWAVYKALSGAYKYAITQTFAIPTLDDSEKDKFVTSNKETEQSTNDDSNNIKFTDKLDEEIIDNVLGNPEIDDFGQIFNLKNAG